MSSAKRIVAAIDDVFFMAKVKDAATAAGLGTEFARSLQDAVDRSSGGACLVVIDLNSPKFEPVNLILALKNQGVPVLGFLSHVNVELRAKAVEAGADRVLARSALAQNINSIFREFAAAD
jgi:DNA-binding response OmpR family regulator